MSTRAIHSKTWSINP